MAVDLDPLAADKGQPVGMRQELLDLGKIRTTSNKCSGVRTKIGGRVWYARPSALAALYCVCFLVGSIFRC